MNKEIISEIIYNNGFIQGEACGFKTGYERAIDDLQKYLMNSEVDMNVKYNIEQFKKTVYTKCT